MEFADCRHLIRIKLFIFRIKKFYQFLNIIKFTPIVLMNLRLQTLSYNFTLLFAKKLLVFLLLAIVCPSFSQNPSSNKDLIKQADKLFEQEEYSKAYKLYSQLVSNFPKDPLYNYRLGVCMIYSEPDKKKSLPYLKFAAASAEGNKDLNDVLFYLGKAHHINYHFDDAIKNYSDYKLTASSSQIKKLEVDREIKACSNGKHLLSNLTDLEVLSKSELPESDYFRSYKKVGGKLLVKPDEFKTSSDKKKKEKSIVFLPNGSNVVYFSSYGDNDGTGKDIYTTYRQADGTYSEAEKVQGVNTEFDEDYPFLHPDGKTLYFASKGFNSMGGYDIFKSIFNEETGKWGSPVNMEFPINSPDDDYLFVTDSLETIAYFSTGRQSVPGKIDVLKVKTKRRPIDIIAMKGNVIQGNPEYSLKSSIIVKDLFNQNEIGEYESKEDGSYSMELPNGSKLLFTVKTPGLETQSAQVSIPVASAAKPYRQTISYEKGKLKILNYFDELENDNSYLQYLNVIEKKAKLEVNGSESESDSATPLAVNTNNPGVPKPTEEITKSKEAEVEATNSTDTPGSALEKGVDNLQLAKIAKQDAEELLQEASQLKTDYKTINETGLTQKAEAEKKLAEADQALNNASLTEDETERKAAIEKATDLKKSAENDLIIANKVLAVAATLNEDAKKKEKEGKLNSEYARELEKSSKNKGNAGTSARLEELQKEISELSSQGNSSEEAISAIKTDIVQKEKQIADVEQINQTIKSNLDEVKVAIADKETELSKTKKKSLKKELSTEIVDLKEEEAEKIKQITANEAEIIDLKEDLATAKTQLEQVTNTNKEVRPESAKASEVITAKSLQEKYKGKTIINDANNSSSIKESNAELVKYNSELDQLISKNKTELSKTKNKDLQSKLDTDIKQAELVKKENSNLIASNKQKIEALNKAEIQTSAKSEIKTTFNPITAESEAEAITKLDELNKQLVFNDTQNFDYNGYQSPDAQNLKVEADAKINDAVAKQKILKEEIGNSKKNMEGGSTASAMELTSEAEKIHTEAQTIRSEAKKKKGAEKEELLTKAKILEEDANTKHIEAAEIVRADNAAIFAANDENIQNLIKENQSSEDDIAKAKELNDEAKENLRKAADIRLEGNSLSSSGAKLGSYSNAEEKEAEALLKQNQALDFLTMSNPTFVLKKANTSASRSNSNNTGDIGNTGDVNSKLERVNNELSDLAAIKIESYQKLNEANATEIAQLKRDLKENQTTIDKTPSLKTDVLSANTKIEKANNFKLQAENASNPNEKLSNLITSIKKQNEAIEQLNAIKKSIEGTSGSTAFSQVAKQNTPTPKKTQNNETPTAKSNDLSMLSEIDIVGAESEPAVQSDTTTGQIISYFDDNNLYMRNTQAGATAKNSLRLLKDFESEQSDISAKLKTVASGGENNSSATSVMELNEKVESLITESEALTLESSNLRNEARDKNREEQTELLAKAKKIDLEAQDKMIKASEYKKEATDQEYKTNANAITELLTKLKTDNPGLASEIESRRDDYSLLKTQSKNLREEANALSNKAAKIGALSNVEEKEAELMLKQSAVLSELQQKYPDYVVKQVAPQSSDQQKSELQQKKTQIQEKQYQELTNLINAFSLEYESSKNNVSSTLSSDEEDIQQRAAELSSTSKRLLIQSSQEKNENEKIKLLTQAAKSGNKAVEELNKLLRETNRPKNDLDQLGEIENDYVIVNTDVASEPKTTPKNNKNNNSPKVDGLKVVSGNAYSNANPIPIDAAMESGLVFRVQIGAFKTRLADNAFRGLSPLNGETTNSGYIRYTAGNFYAIENANAVKNDLRNLGYGDAFVVVYFNGRRITLAEALAEMEKQGKTIDPNAPKTAGITANSNVPKATANPFVQESVTVTQELEQMDGLLYTIQIGVFSKQVSKPQILSLKPIFREQLTNGLYRYTAGIYNNPEKLLLDKARVVDMGIRDAFVSAYLNGKRIPFKEAKELQERGEQLKLEKENPIVFPTSSSNNAPSELDVLLNTSVDVQPFKNQVNDYPTPTESNGVKTTEQGICYKVQIGAFSKQVPAEVATKFSSIRTWPVDNKQINGLFIYNIGNFSERRFASDLKDEANSVGIEDAFITVYRDGRKLYGAEAEAYMR
jgi:hypothetical protein